MEQPQQTFANHTRWVPIYHFFAFPLIAVATGWAAYSLVSKGFSMDLLIDLLFKIGVFIAVLKSRLFPLKAQDRVIRLEERLRIAKVLAPEAQAKAASITDSQLISLRFASDAELPGLIEKTLAGNWDGKQIKQAITNWRPDYHRV